MTTRRVPLHALAVAACLVLIATGCGDDEPAQPDVAAPVESIAESDVRSAGGNGSSDQAQASSDVGFVGGGSCSAPWTPAATAPEGVTIDGWASAFYEKADDEPIVIAALASENGVEQSAIDCVFSEDPAVADDGPPEAADRAATAPPAPARAESDEPVGFGWCGADWEPELPAGTLPEGARINLNASANFGPKEQLAPARAALVAASGQPAARIECSHEIPPVGECFVDLAPGTEDGLPEGARVEGNVFGTFVRGGDRARVKAAVAALGGVPESQVRCVDFPDESEAIDEPLPIEPGDAPAVSGPAPETE